MRSLIPLLGLMLASCGDDRQAANTAAVAEESDATALTPANDVTAIDAATGDAANMAADVNFTLEDLDNEAYDNSSANSVANN